MNSISYKPFGRYKYKTTAKHAYKTGIEGQAVENKYIRLLSDGTLIIAKGYCWNGANCTPDTTTNIFASLIHDALYQLIREKLIRHDVRKDADKIYIQICREDGMLCIRRFIHYIALRIFGRLNAR